MSQVSFGEDFGQKVDLTASIRNILRNYPEGTAILKELVQNADDAGAKVVRFCLDHRTHPATSIANPSLAQFQGPSLLVYNDAVFTSEDFASIQRIGDSLKNIGNESKTKIGRFGIGFNAVYHWTELPSFISDHFLVMLDPSAKYLPNVNPNNPGKIVDWLRDKTIISQLEDQFRPYQLTENQWKQAFPGTLFRLPLRNQEQANTSHLSKRALDIEQVSEVLKSLAAEAVSMLLFLRRVERIEIAEWRPFSTAPETLFTCDIANISPALRAQRSFDDMLGRNRAANIAGGRTAVADFSLQIRTESRLFGNTTDTWRVCTQFGGGAASNIARMSENAHLKLVPIAGVAACMTTEGQELIPRNRSGAAYCFLPLPIQTELPVMVNGFFELSSNRRDIWQESVDMTGDGNTRAKWNESILRDIVAPCYVRLLHFAKEHMGFSEIFEGLWPSHRIPKPWATVMNATYALAHTEKLLHIRSSTPTTASNAPLKWIEPRNAVILPFQASKALTEAGAKRELLEILSLLQVPVVEFKNLLLHESLIHTNTCTSLATPAFLRKLLRGLSPAQRQLLQVTMCRFLMHFCLEEVTPAEWMREWQNLPVLPLIDGTVGAIETFAQLQVSSIEQLQLMGYSLQESIAALSEFGFDVTRACESLMTDPSKRIAYFRQQKRWYFILASAEEWKTFASSASSGASPMASQTIFVDTRALHVEDVEFLRSVDCQRVTNLRSFAPILLKDIIPCLLPAKCCDTERAMVTKSELTAAEQSSLVAFSRLFWKYASEKPAVYLNAITQSYAIVPVESYEAWYPLSKLSNIVAPAKGRDGGALPVGIVEVLRKVGVPLLEMSVFDDVVDMQTMPSVFWEYVHGPHRVGVLTALGYILRGETAAKFIEKMNSQWTATEKHSLRQYLMEGASSELTEPLLHVLKSLPMFPTVRMRTSPSATTAAAASTSAAAGEDDGSDEAVETVFVSLATQKWTTLPSFADIPRSYLGSTMVLHETVWEAQLLTSLGVRTLTWTEFYQTNVLQQATAHFQRNAAVYEAAIVKMLLDLPSITRNCPREQERAFYAFLRATAFVPTADTTPTLNRIEELYDPSNAEMQTLLQPSFFPANRLCLEEVLTTFRSLGLRTIIDWRGIVDCARSVESIAMRCSTTVNDEERENIITQAQQRGRTLLQYLDTNVTRLLGEEKKPVPPTATTTTSASGGGGRFSLFGTISSFFAEKTETASEMAATNAAKKEEMDLCIAQLRTIAWIPVLRKALDPCMPWKSELRTNDEDGNGESSLVSWQRGCCPPDECAPASDAWFCSARYFIISSDIHVREPSLRRILNWQGQYSVQTLAIQLRAIAAKYQAFAKRSNVADDRGASTTAAAATAQELQSLRQQMATIIPELYTRLERCSATDIALARGFLEQAEWIWVGDNFVSLSKVAVTFPVYAAPYLYALPEELKAYPRLLTVFPWKQTFSYRDYIATLRDMAIESGYPVAGMAPATSAGFSAGAGSSGVASAVKPLSESMIDVAIALVSLISNETAVTLQAHVIFVPDIHGRLAPSPELVNDDVPWVQGVANMTLRASCRLVHPNISAKVAEKVGVKSMRLDILEKTKDNDLFAGHGGSAAQGFESFGQAESLTNRLKTILDLYPDGSQILNELVQNADDAGATCVKIVVDENTYGSESLMDGRMEALQGPALLFYNNAVFSEADFKSLASVGQGSKKEKLATTGRFGLGFNSTYHLTDTPTFVSGDYFVFFDPHCSYVPGATMNQPGIKFRYTDSTLGNIFPHQFEPFQHCDFDMAHRFPGTLFRFPLRNAMQARSSGISRRSYKLEDLTAVVNQMIDQLSYMLLFLRSVKRIEIYRCYEGQRHETLLYTAQAAESDGDNAAAATEMTGDMSLLEYFEKRNNPLQFSRDSFYAKLLATADGKLPTIATTKCIQVEEYAAARQAMTAAGGGGEPEVVSRQLMEYEYIYGLVGGQAKQLACSEDARHMKLVPFGGVAACTKRVRITHDPQASSASSSHPQMDETLFPALQQGQAFCFLPLPIQTKLPVLVNAYWELSSNRRDIWRGDDTQGESRIRSDWNKHILQEIIPHLYAQLLLRLTRRFPVTSMNASRHLLQILPTNPVPAPWDTIRDMLLPFMQQIPLFWTAWQQGRCVSAATAIFIDTQAATEGEQRLLQRLAELLLEDGLPIVLCETGVKQWLEDTASNKPSLSSFREKHMVSPGFIRNHFKATNGTSASSSRRQITTAHPVFDVDHLQEAPGAPGDDANSHSEQVVIAVRQRQVMAKAAFFLQYALRDYATVGPTAYFHVQLLPIQTNEIVVIDDMLEGPHYYLLQATERKLLTGIADAMIVTADNDLGEGIELNKVLLQIHDRIAADMAAVVTSSWNIRRIDDVSVVKLVTEGVRRRYVPYQGPFDALPPHLPNNTTAAAVAKKAWETIQSHRAWRSVANVSDKWLRDMWRYMLDDKKLGLYQGTIPLLPVLATSAIHPQYGASYKPLVRVHKQAPVVYLPASAYGSGSGSRSPTVSTVTAAAAERSSTNSGSSIDVDQRKAIVEALWKIGVYVLDDEVMSPFVSYAEFLDNKTGLVRRVHNTTAGGLQWLDAFAAIGTEQLHHLAAGWTPVDRVVMHQLVLDEILRASPDFALSSAQQELLLSLPIWITHTRKANYRFPSIEELLWQPRGPAATADGSSSSSATYTFSALRVESHFLPPAEITSELLDPLFLVLREDDDRPKYERLGLQSIPTAHFVVNDLLAKLDRQALSEDELLWTSKFLLRQLPTFVRDVPTLRDRLYETAFVRNDVGEWKAPTALYDLDNHVLKAILPRACFPDANVYRESQLMQSLHMLGLRRQINAEGILLAAKSIQVEQQQLRPPPSESSTTAPSTAAMAAPTAEPSTAVVVTYETLFDRCCNLLRYLENHIATILDEVDADGLQAWKAAGGAATATATAASGASGASASGASATVSTLSSGRQLGGSWAQELRSILWIAVYTKPPTDARDKGLPWPANLHAISFAAPMHCANKRHLWLVSSSMRVASVEVVSPELTSVLGWDKAIPGSIIAIQLTNMAAEYMILQTVSDDSLTAAKAKYDEVYPTILRALYDQYTRESDVQRNHWLRSLYQKPVIWTASGQFIETHRVSFTAIANVRVEPFLYIATTYMSTYKEMLLRMGVREAFDIHDLAMMTRKFYELSPRHQPLTTAALEDTIGLVTLLHRMLLEKFSPVPVEGDGGGELAGTAEDGEAEPSTAPQPPAATWSAEAMRDEVRNLGVLYLPDSHNVLYPATELTYNDAPWISAAQAGRYHAIKFLHPRLDVTTATAAAAATATATTMATGMAGASLGELFGCRSFREVLFAGTTVFCPSAKTIAESLGDNRHVQHTINDLLFLADTHDCQRVEVFYDATSYPTESLLHPGLAATQGPALLVYLVGKVLSTEEITKWMTIPTLSNEPRNVASRLVLARGGTRLLSGFAVSDCLQILSGSDMYVFDPTGAFLEHNTTASTASTAATGTTTHGHASNEDAKAQKFNLLRERQETTSNASAVSSGSQNLILSFSDQFAPYFAVSDAIRHDLCHLSRIGGTIIRLPLRTAFSSLSQHVVDTATMQEVIGRMKSSFVGCLSFANALTSVTVSHKDVDDGGMVVDLGVDMISDATLRSSRWQLAKTPGWDRQGLSSLFQSFKPVEKAFKLSFTVRLGMQGWMKPTSSLAYRLKQFASPSMHHTPPAANGNGSANVVCYPEVWLITGTMGHEQLREVALTEPFKSLRLLPLVHLAIPLLDKGEMMAHEVGMEDGWLCDCGSVMQPTGFPFHVEGQFLTIAGQPLYGSGRSSAPTQQQQQNIVTVWNDSLLSTMVQEMYLKFLRDWKQQLEDEVAAAAGGGRPAAATAAHGERDILEWEGMYKYWLYTPRLHETVTTASTALAGSRWQQKLSSEKMFMLDRKVFVTLDKVVFPTTTFSTPTLQYLRSTMPLARTPMQIGLDFRENRHIVPPPSLLTAARFRSTMARDSSVHYRRLSAVTPPSALGTLVWELLHFAVSDLIALQRSADEGDFSKKSAYATLRGCPLLLMADGSVGMFAIDPQRYVALAPDVIVAVLPASLRTHLLRASHAEYFPLFHDVLFREAVGLTELTPTFLKDFVGHLLPPTLVGSKGFMWVDTYDQQTAALDAAMLEKVLYVLWNTLFHRLSFLQLLVLGDVPLLPAISAGRRVLLPVAAMPYLFTPVIMTTVEDSYRAQIKDSVEAAQQAFVAAQPTLQPPSTGTSTGTSTAAVAKPWEWTSERPYRVPRYPATLRPPAVAVEVSSSPSAAPAAGTEAAQPPSVPQATAEAATATAAATATTATATAAATTTATAAAETLGTFAVSVETFTALKKLGVPFLDTLLFANKPLALQQQEHIQVDTFQHVGRKLLDTLHNFGVVYPHVLNVVDPPPPPSSTVSAASASSASMLSSSTTTTAAATAAASQGPAYAAVPVLSFAALSFAERYELLTQMHQAHRAKAFSEDDLRRVRELPLFTNAMDGAPVAIRPPPVTTAASTSSSLVGGLMALAGGFVAAGGAAAAAASATATGAAAPATAAQVYWCADTSSVLQTFGQHRAAAAGHGAANDAPMPIIVQSGSSGGQQSLTEIFNWLQVPELTPALAMTSFVLPTMETMSMREQAQLIETLAAQWTSLYREDTALKQALKTKRFIPRWDVDAPELWRFQATPSTATIAENDYYVSQSVPMLRRCDEVVSWTNAELLAALSVSKALPAYVAPPAWQTPAFFAMFKDLGMPLELTEDMILRVAKDIEHSLTRCRQQTAAQLPPPPPATAAAPAVAYGAPPVAPDEVNVGNVFAEIRMRGRKLLHYLLGNVSTATATATGAANATAAAMAVTTTGENRFDLLCARAPFQKSLGKVRFVPVRRPVRVERGGFVVYEDDVVAFDACVGLAHTTYRSSASSSSSSSTAAGSQGASAASQNQAALLSFTVLPLLDGDVTPPSMYFSSLGIVHPATLPSKDVVTAHVRRLTHDSDFVLDRWNQRSFSVVQTFNAIFAYLADQPIASLGPDLQRLLRSDYPLVPVGHTLVPAQRIFFSLPKLERSSSSSSAGTSSASLSSASSAALLAPFLYELPRAFASFESFFTRTLSMRESPTVEDYLQVLQAVSGGANASSSSSTSATGWALNPNELRAVLAILQMMVQSVASSSEAAAGRTLQAYYQQYDLYVPDQRGIMRPLAHVYVNDDPYLYEHVAPWFEQPSSTQWAFYPLHPQLISISTTMTATVTATAAAPSAGHRASDGPATTTASGTLIDVLGIRRLSSLVEERLVQAVAYRDDDPRAFTIDLLVAALVSCGSDAAEAASTATATATWSFLARMVYTARRAAAVAASPSTTAATDLAQRLRQQLQSLQFVVTSALETQFVVRPAASTATTAAASSSSSTSTSTTATMAASDSRAVAYFWAADRRTLYLNSRHPFLTAARSTESLQSRVCLIVSVVLCELWDVAVSHAVAIQQALLPCLRAATKVSMVALPPASTTADRDDCDDAAEALDHWNVLLRHLSVAHEASGSYRRGRNDSDDVRMGDMLRAEHAALIELKPFRRFYVDEIVAYNAATAAAAAAGQPLYRYGRVLSVVQVDETTGIQRLQILQREAAAANGVTDSGDDNGDVVGVFLSSDILAFRSAASVASAPATAASSSSVSSSSAAASASQRAASATAALLPRRDSSSAAAPMSPAQAAPSANTALPVSTAAATVPPTVVAVEEIARQDMVRQALHSLLERCNLPLKPDEAALLQRVFALDQELQRQQEQARQVQDDYHRVQEQLKHHVEAFQCTLCNTHPVSISLVPCGHTVCRECNDHMTASRGCPFCRKAVTQRMTLFFLGAET